MEIRSNACLAAIVLAAGLSGAQTASSVQSSGVDAAVVAAAESNLSSLLNAFVNEASASGIPCSIKSPKLVVQDVPSFGSYDPDTNTLTTPVWEQLTAEERSIFFKGAGPNAREADARAEFELGAHHWIFVHELGHWWEACRGMSDHGDHYAFESEANKIAAAYWNEHDPAVIAHQRQVFQTILQKWPNPVPSGQSAAPFFNENYEKLGPTPAYIWFQAKMCIDAFAEQPLPRFSVALAKVVRN